jgi:hypothetical protein
MIAGSGERLFVGDRVSTTIRNLGEAPLYFDVGAASTIEMVTNATPSGRLIAAAGQPGDTDTVGGASGPALAWQAASPLTAGAWRRWL